MFKPVFRASSIYPQAARQNAIFVLIWRLVHMQTFLSPVGFLDTPSQRVQFILGTEEDEEHVPHELFTELDEIDQSLLNGFPQEPI